MKTWLFAVLGITAMSYAQIGGNGAIQGRVTDNTGAVIPNAAVTARNVATGINTSSTTTGAGVYVLSPLLPGEYTVTVTAQGFATAVQEHIAVDATRSVGLDMKLNVGKRTETVTVTDAPPALETTDATLGETMENKTYSALPLAMGNGLQRDPTAFAGLMPGVGSGGRSGVYNGQGSGNGYLNELYMDGIPITTISQQGDNRNVSMAVSVDAVDQFQVITSGASAMFTGMGAQNFVIKSGTNRFHGSVSDFIRNTAFDSWGFFAKAATVPKLVNGQIVTVPASKPVEHNNELALTLGGPILKNKLFFFVSYDKYHYRAGVNPSLISIPTALERTGNFTELPNPIYDPTTYASCTAANNGVPCTKQFRGMLNGLPTNNVIPASEISPQSQFMQKFMPAPTTSGTQNNLLTGLPNGNDNWALNVKVDYQITPRQRFSVLSNSGQQLSVPLDYLGEELPAPYTDALYHKQVSATGVLEHSFVISDHLVNNLKYAYLREWGPGSNPFLNNSMYDAATAVGIGNLPEGQAASTFPNVSFTDFANAPTAWTSNSGYTQITNTYEIMDNLQWSRGKHNVTFGFLYQWLSENESNWDTPSKVLSLGFSNVNTSGYTAGKVTNTTTGNSYASFLMGAVNSTGVSVQPFTMLGARFRAFSPNVQDDWRVNSKLTLNLGLRWDIFTTYHEVQNRWSYLNVNETNPATGTPGAIEFVGDGTYSCHCRTPVDMYWGNVGPRLGLAYSVNNKTVVRAAFSTVYSHGGGVGGRGGANNGTGQTGLTGSATFPGTGQSGAIPALYLNSSSDFTAAGIANTGLPAFTATNNVTPFRDPTVNTGNYINSSGVAVAPQGVSYADPYVSSRAPYAENWNIGIERVLRRDLILSVNYSASQSHFLTGSSRGPIINQLDPKYEVLQGLLKQLPGNVDSATGKTYLQEAQAIIPGIAIPYADFGGPTATIQAMLEPHPQYGGISDTWGNTGNANYNSLQLTLSQRLDHGVSFTLNYTYGKEIDDTGTHRTGYAIPASAITDGIARPLNSLDRSLGTANQPQLLRSFGVWEMPFGKGHLGGQNRLVRVLASGWALSGIFQYNSGAPLAITASGCEVVGQGTCMPSYTPGYTHSPRINGGWGKGITPVTASSIHFIDSSAFTIPSSTYQLGNIARTGTYNLFGPGGFNLDNSLRRSFKIKDDVIFVFQADAFNVTNAVHFNIASQTVTSNAATSNFGTISGQSNSARDWQFSGHLNF